MARQLGLFGAPGLDFSAERALAAGLPPHVSFGTSAWTFPGWGHLAYPPGATEADLLERGLELYVRHPLFTTVGIDRSYYAPLDRSTLKRYAEQLPPGFRAVMKVWNAITQAVDPKTREPNPRFLSVDCVVERVLGPIDDAFAEHAGPLVFEFPPLRRRELPEPRAFADRLGEFFAKLPRQLSYAVELRNPELLSHGYLEVLAQHGVGHVLNFWQRMPDIGAQLDVPGVLTAPFVVSRLLIPPGQSYEDRKRSLAPFDRVVDPQEKMRDDVARLAEACEKLGKVLLVIVNNKAEGSSPLTVRALAERIARPRPT